MIEIIHYEKDKHILHRPKIIDFMIRMDELFVPTLKSRNIDIPDYFSKMEEKGEIIFTFDNEDRILGACLFYCNDFVAQTAFGTWLCVLEEARHLGLGFLLICEALEICRKKSMKYFELQTWKTNEMVIQMYKKGFQAEIVKEFFESGRQTVRLRVTL